MVFQDKINIEHFLYSKKNNGTELKSNNSIKTNSIKQENLTGFVR